MKISVFIDALFPLPSCAVLSDVVCPAGLVCGRERRPEVRLGITDIITTWIILTIIATSTAPSVIQNAAAHETLATHAGTATMPGNHPPFIIFDHVKPSHTHILLL